MNSKIVKQNIKSLNYKYKNNHKNYEYNKSEITPRKNFDQAYVCVYEVMPLKSTYPKHYHTCNTECFYIISGKGIVETTDDVFPVESGDIIVFPCGVEGAHKLINSSDKEKLVYIDFDTTNSPDIIHYVDSDKIGIIQHNVSSTFYKTDDNVDYFDGEK